MGVKQFSIYRMPEVINEVDAAVKRVEEAISTLNVSVIKSIQTGLTQMRYDNAGADQWALGTDVNIGSVDINKSVVYCNYLYTHPVGYQHLANEEALTGKNSGSFGSSARFISDSQIRLIAQNGTQYGSVSLGSYVYWTVIEFK